MPRKIDLAEAALRAHHELEAYRMATGGLDPRLVFRLMQQAQVDCGILAKRISDKCPDTGPWLLSDLHKVVDLHLQYPSAGPTKGPET